MFLAGEHIEGGGGGGQALLNASDLKMSGNSALKGSYCTLT